MMSDISRALNPLNTLTDSDTRAIYEQFLRFFLEPETTMILPVNQVIEVLTIPLGKIIPLPHMPNWVMGIYNWRGEILWMVDLGYLVGLTPWYQQELYSSNHRALVLKAHSGNAELGEQTSETLGLVVSKIEDMEWCNPNEIQSPPFSAVTPELAPFLRGYWIKANGELLIAIDGDAIMAAMPKP
jgi:positive phototaxis protein PixI